MMLGQEQIRSYREQQIKTGNCGWTKMASVSSSESL